MRRNPAESSKSARSSSSRVPTASRCRSRYRALEIGNEFIVGYGLDYDQLGRSLEDIYVVTE